MNWDLRTGPSSLLVYVECRAHEEVTAGRVAVGRLTVKVTRERLKENAIEEVKMETDKQRNESRPGGEYLAYYRVR